jgi:DNA invertase Pin-like site-specific DNA recombinase
MGGWRRVAASDWWFWVGVGGLEKGQPISWQRVAEMELGFIKARQRDGIERAKSKGDVKGRKPTIDRSTVRDLFNEGIGASEIARRLKIGRASVYRVLEK